MPDNQLLVNNSSDSLGYRNITIKGMDKVDDYLFIILDNGQKILTNGQKIYNCSEYSHFTDIFPMGDRLCAVFTKYSSISVVDLNKMEVLFEDRNAYHVSMQDERTLHVIMKRRDKNNTTIYDIETKKYLPAPDEYEFEHSLGNNLYVFREQNNFSAHFYDYKRCVINADGIFLLKDIEGWIYYSNNHLIIIKQDELCIVGVNDQSTLDMITIKQNENIIAKPAYYDGNIILIEKGVIKIYTPSLELVRELYIDELENVIDYEIVADTLKIALSHTIDDKQIGKHLFVNLKTGRSISHIRIEGYPYWNPTTYIGQDSVDTEVTNFHFYNANFDLITSIRAYYYESIESNKECMFIIASIDNNGEKQLLLNAETGVMREINYDYVHFHNTLPYGYGVNFSTNKIDFFDENLNIIIPGFDYKKYNFDFRYTEFSYFIVNDYICLIKHIAHGPRSFYRSILQKANGEVILDSIEHKCYPMGNLIQILSYNGSQFLNTKTGEIGTLSITAPTDAAGKIDFNQINDFNRLLTIGSTSQLFLLFATDTPTKKLKKQRRNKKDD